MKWAGVVALWVCVGGWAGCGGDAGPDAEDVRTDTSGEASWQVGVSGLEGALLSVWGGAHDDVWVVGADPHDGTGPLVIHGTTGWRRMDLRPVDPTGGHLWWVCGPGSEAVWVVGEGGRAFRYDRAEGSWAKVETGTDATLYGLWGASEDELWAVGGYVFPRMGPPTIVRLTKAGGQVVAELPEGVIESGTFFKVWGSAADDVYVIGEQGMLLRWDGEAWTRVDLGAAVRLVTVHGRSAEDVVIVGGTSQALILEGGRGVFVDRSPGPYPLLSGVHVAPDGSAVAVGMLGQVLRRSAAGQDWSAVSDLPVMKDWHAVWRDPRGDLWLVGGNLLSAARFDEGLIVRYGPERGDGPRGALVDLEPVEPSPEVVEADAVEADVVEAEEVVDAAPDVDGGEVEDAGPVDVEVAQDAAEDAGGDSDGEQDVSVDADTGLAEPFEIGRPDPVAGTFVPLAADEVVDLVHGPQGGFHVEAMVRFVFDSDADSVPTGVDFVVEVDGAVRASFKSMAYPMPKAGEDLYQSYVMTSIFCDDPPPGNCYVPSFDSSPFDGKKARLLITLTPPGLSWSRTLDVTLRDTF